MVPLQWFSEYYTQATEHCHSLSFKIPLSRVTSALTLTISSPPSPPFFFCKIFNFACRNMFLSPCLLSLKSEQKHLSKYDPVEIWSDISHLACSHYKVRKTIEAPEQAGEVCARCCPRWSSLCRPWGEHLQVSKRCVNLFQAGRSPRPWPILWPSDRPEKKCDNRNMVCARGKVEGGVPELVLGEIFGDKIMISVMAMYCCHCWSCKKNDDD